MRTIRAAQDAIHSAVYKQLRHMPVAMHAAVMAQRFRQLL